MTQLSKERLEEIRDYDTCVTLEESAEMARRLLAVEGQEPVAYMTYKGYLLHAADPKVAEYSEPMPLYAAPQPAPVAQPVQVPDEVLRQLLPDVEKADFWFEHEGNTFFEGVKFNDAVFEACRAAVLNQTHVKQPSSGALQLPDGYVLVPVEPTAAMYEAGDQQLATKHVWDAMVSAAPQEPTK